MHVQFVVFAALLLRPSCSSVKGDEKHQLLTPPLKSISWERKEISSPNLVSALLKPQVNVCYSFKQIQNLTQNGDFAPPAVWRFLPILPVF